MILRALNPLEPEDLNFLREHFGDQFTMHARGIVALDSERFCILGASVFDHWTPNSGFITVRVLNDRRAFWRKLVEESLRYFFDIAKRDILFARIAATNEKSLKVARQVGMAEVARVPDGYARGDDMVLLSLHRDDKIRFKRNRKAG